MANALVSPNLHVILIHYPLGLLIVGTLIELFSFMWRRHGFRAAGRWMILLGALGAIPTTTAGLYALADVSRMGMSEPDAQMSWKDLAAESPLWKNGESEAAEHIRDHVWQQSIATALAVLVCVTWLGCSDKWRSKLHLPLLALLLIAVGFLLVGAWNGGEAVYRHGVAIEIEAPATAHPTTGEASEHHPVDLAHLMPPPLEMHVILAGVTIAVAMAALGLSIRAVSVGPGIPQVDQIANALGTGSASVGMESDIREPLETHPEDPRLRVPSARFWILAALIGLLTAAAGWWVLSRGLELDRLDPTALRKAVLDRDQANGSLITRRLAHTVAGVSIVVLSLILAITARFAPRAKPALIVFAALLLIIVAAQVWFGVLLLFDTNVGKVTEFN